MDLVTNVINGQLIATVYYDQYVKHFKQRKLSNILPVDGMCH